MAACARDEASAPHRPELALELRPAAQAIDERRFEEAREVAQAYLAEHPDDAQALFLLGMSHALTDNHGAARPYLEAALERAPDFDLAWEPLAKTRFLLGDLAGARAAYAEFARRVPGDPKGPHGIGLVDLEESRLADAGVHFRKALKLFDALERDDPRQATVRLGERSESHARLGEVLFAKEDLAGARRELLRAVVLSAGNLSALYTLSLVHRRLGETELADVAADRYERARLALLAEQGSAAR
ncbi:MAG: tetratricopeptide repeat protein [Planctomycetota bacterium]